MVRGSIRSTETVFVDISFEAVGRKAALREAEKLRVVRRLVIENRGCLM